MDRYGREVAALLDAVSGPLGRADAGLRHAVRARVARMVAGDVPAAAPDLPAPLVDYVDTVARHAYKVSDESVDRLRQAGYSDDEIFDVTVNAAVSAGLSRLTRALDLLKKSPR
jgi:hypothetical protein